MRSLKLFILFSIILGSLLTAKPAFAQLGKTILFVPQDNRPISYTQTANNIRAMGYTVLTPPEHLIGNRDDLGHPEELTKWVLANAGKADFAIISSDALVYGSLVASRKHHISPAVLEKRVHDAFVTLHEKYPYLFVYVFGSIMRTPQTSAASSEEPYYYKTYGTQIARYTALIDKAEKTGLTRKEKRELQELTAAIPPKAIDDWLGRRVGNFDVSRDLIALAQKGAITYLTLGCDDNAEYSQTDLEWRRLNQYAAKIDCTNYNSVAGIDELAMILLTRAVNQIEGNIPFVAIHYPPGVGAATIPAYSNEPIANSARMHIIMAGGIQVPNDARADLILLENTTHSGITYAANDANNTPNADLPNTKPFVEMVGKYLAAGKNVGVADIAFGNGADNALMQQLWQKGYLDKLGAYAGWNTPTNSSGYAIGMGMLASYADHAQKIKMLTTRYLDDWLYEANIRQQVANKMDTFPGKGGYGDTGTRTKAAEAYATKLMRADVLKYGLEKMTGNQGLVNVEVFFPWHRLFEAGFLIK